MEYENKEAKKFVQWFLLCSVIILLLTGTVTTLVVRNYRARENEAVTAMLGIVLKNDGIDTEKSRQEKISECMHILEHPHAYQKFHQKEIKEAEKILQSYGISEAEPVIAGTKTMERRILFGTLGGVLLAVPNHPFFSVWFLLGQSQRFLERCPTMSLLPPFFFHDS